MSAATIQTAQLLHLGRYFTAASLCISVWDWLVRLDDEVAFIWRMPPTTYVKWLYIFEKYFTLVVQTVCLVVQVNLENQPRSLQFCRVYRAFEMGSVTLLMLFFDILLVLRIYALYGRRTWSCVLAVSAVLMECITTVASVASTIPVADYDSACALNPVPRSTLAYAIGMFISQTILLLLTYRKRQYVIGERPSIACITIRDGMLAFAGLFVFIVIVLIYDLIGSSVSTLIIYWLPMLSSVAACRIILNLQQVPHDGPSYQFTTEIWGLEGSADSYPLADQQYRSCSP